MHYCYGECRPWHVSCCYCFELYAFCLRSQWTSSKKVTQILNGRGRRTCATVFKYETTYNRTLCSKRVRLLVWDRCLMGNYRNYWIEDLEADRVIWCGGDVDFECLLWLLINTLVCFDSKLWCFLVGSSWFALQRESFTSRIQDTCKSKVLHKEAVVV